MLLGMFESVCCGVLGVVVDDGAMMSWIELRHIHAELSLVCRCLNAYKMRLA